MKHFYKYIEPIPSFYHHSIFPLEIKQSTIPNAGLGVFSLTDIPKNTYIDGYYGDKFSNPTSRYFITITDEIGIDAVSYPRCYMAMLNDSYNTLFQNNCEFIINEKDQTVSVWTIKEIKSGEELFTSYGEDYWK
jgi:hypothetical protein